MRDPRLQTFAWETPGERGRSVGRGAALALREQQEALETEQWSLALQRSTDLLQGVAELTLLLPGDAGPFWHEAGEAIARLTAVLHPRLNLQSEQPLAEPERSDLCWQLTTLLDQALGTPVALPAWVGVMHTQLLLSGAIYWRDRLSQADDEPAPDIGGARERAARLFGRAAHRLDPVPAWVSQACVDLGVGSLPDPKPPEVADESSAGSAPPPPAGSVPASPSFQEPEPVATPGSGPTGDSHSRLWPPSQLAEELEHALVMGGPRRQLRIGLVCIPGAAMLCREGNRFDLNLAALLQDPSGVAADPWFEAFRDPLRRAQEAGWLPLLELSEPFSSLYDSLCHHWRLGCALPPGQLGRIPALLDAWQRVFGPAQLQAQRLPSSLINAGSCKAGATASLQVRLDPLELAALTACAVAFGADGLKESTSTSPAEAALAELRRQHQNNRFWQAEADAPRDLLEALRLLQRDRGFYASSAAPLACLERWYDGTLDCMERAKIWGTELSDDAIGLLTLAQQLTLHAGRLPCLRPRLPLQEILERMAGREVLYVGWAAAAVLEQHRSGRAFRLFHDRSIAPYGLRAVAMPDSRHPLRPHGGFRDSLDHLIAAVELEQEARPLDLLVVDQGAYRLPLLSAIERRHGIAGVAPGPDLLQLFGLDCNGVARWCEPSRDPAMWRKLS